MFFFYFLETFERHWLSAEDEAWERATDRGRELLLPELSEYFDIDLLEC